MSHVRLILYSKPGCHLCEGLQEKLEQIQSLDLELEVRDITTRQDWFQAYQYEVPVLFLDRGLEQGRVEGTEEHSTCNIQDLKSLSSPSLTPLPRFSPRATVQQLEQMLQKYLPNDRRE
ncbi:glutaredoxin family protein [Leptothermofonsia sp. ETS-13]|uniref:glutaredoxin family protein n=1 Tax=Leptothermofonsia sp. ETS-13 TaxID=3035696 RepID=UPI003BA1CDDD